MPRFTHRFIFTENCDKSCPHCFNADTRTGRRLDADRFISWMQLNKNFLKDCRLKIMGGEPTLHPDFKQMTKAAIDYYGYVVVFTNGADLKKIKTKKFLGSRDIGFIINGYTAPYADYLNLEVAFHFVIPYHKKEFNAVTKKAADFAEKNIKLIISADTKINLFNKKILKKYRRRYVDFFKTVKPKKYSFDHPMPLCFWNQETIKELKKLDVKLAFQTNRNCCDLSIGLVDPDFVLFYCNQTRIKIGSVENKTIDQIEEMIQSAPQKKLEHLGRPCSMCPASTVCKAACWFEHVR